MQTTVSDYAVVRLKPKVERRIQQGHPWAFSNEIEMDETARGLPLGVPVRLQTANGKALGIFLFNRHPLIAARRISRKADNVIDSTFIEGRLRRALALRQALFQQPFYRLVHAEADGLPGTIVDRFGDSLVLQINSAGMEALRPELLEAVDRVLAPKHLLLRNDTSARQLEGLEQEVESLRGDFPSPLEVRENQTIYLADSAGGQKTGWFYDQRDNRAFVRRLVKGAGIRRVIDLYSFSGGFALQAALGGAEQVTLVDRSAAALELARQAAAANGVDGRCDFRKADAFAALEHLSRKGEDHDLVIADPPAFVKAKKDLPQGLRAYRKLARLSAAQVAEGGYLVICSCSHHVEGERFTEQVRRGIEDAGRRARILRSAGAAPDHPLHPGLPESAYLKALVLALD
ncbi:class I SAM-dependent rRNA methyltransferase [Fodinicurvata sediminis]|uniref:class I SAM-dependent rRNA methyltransferase n=1 Tax=Fodinicurvata sediminis TaxID=1121832 RepID=UPI0003B5756E|nr:class I SAM-dependent rRNA methyltransferase [Fodinicurvata sediminis]